MQKLFFSLLLFMCIKASAQIEMTNPKLSDPQQNLLFIGIDNVLTISGKGWDPKKMDIILSKYGVTRVADNQYAVRVNAITDSFPVTISEGDKAVFTKYYRVRTIEQPSVRFGEIDRDNNVTIQDLLSNPTVSIGMRYFKGNAFSFDNKLLSYILKITDDKGQVIHERVNTEAKLSDEQISIIKSLKPGAILELSDCIASGSSQDFKVKGLKLTIR